MKVILTGCVLASLPWARPAFMRGILFSGEWLLRFRCATDGYPFSRGNNINGVDDGYRGTSPETAVASVTMTARMVLPPYKMLRSKTIDVLNDLPNVVWIVSQEAPGTFPLVE